MLYQLVEQLQLALYVHDQRAEPQAGGPPPHAAPAGACGAGGSCLLLGAI
jgi:hypothetical protein